ncbi:MAG: glycosyltransferase [Candidatus Heimdallarchaeota archaeon]
MYLWLKILTIVYLVSIVISLLYYFFISLNHKEVLNDAYLLKVDREPFVSIILPTLNEENNIEKCLQSLRSQNYSNFEIILSDGGSKDKTVKLAKKYVDKIIIKDDTPDEWVGKNYGCHLGYEQAQGEILLFTDADTVHAPDALRIFVSKLLEKRAGLVTVFPYQNLRRWWESIVPIYFFLSHLTSGGLKKVNDPRENDSFLGVGQYLLFTREAYEEIGGHMRLKGSIIEDYAFARIVKKELQALFYTPSDKLVRAQMYPESFRHCWTGFKKVLYAGTKLTPPRRITITLLFCLGTIFSPAMITLIAIYQTPHSFWLLIMVIVYVFIISAFAFYWNNKGRHFWVTYFFFPFLMLFFIFTLIASTLEILISKTTTWKGRKYKPDLRAGLNDFENKKEEDFPASAPKVKLKSNQ